MLFKLSLKNIKKSIKDYTIYFFTLILAVAIFYIFNAMETQTVMLEVSNSTKDIIKLMNTMLSGVSVFVSFILGFLIIYASQFLMKRRKKEFGIYMTLGMSKGKISRILLLETILIGTVSLVIGLVIGTILSQGMSIVVANMFEADMTKFSFVFSTKALGKTILYFCIMYFCVMIFNTISVSKCKLIDLITANKKSETIKMKNPILCTIVFILSVVMLGYAYYNVTVLNTTLTSNQLLTDIVLGVIGTFFLFWSLSGFVLKLVMKRKKLYHKNLNMFILRQVNSKINTTVFSMTTISLMLFLTICILSSALSLKNSMTNNLKELTPVDILLSKKANLTSSDQYYGIPYTEEQIADSKTPITDTLELLDFDWKNNLTDMINVNIYATNDITMKDTFGTEYGAIKKEYPMLLYDSAEPIVKVSEYNKVAKLYGNPTYELKEDEYMIIADFDSMVQIRNRALKKGTTLTLNGKTYQPKYPECKSGFIEISANHINTGIILIPDQTLPEEMKEETYLIANYTGKTEDEKEEIEAQLASEEVSAFEDKTTLSASTKISIYEASIGLGAIVTFIGIYLGIIFLISSAAILALKELSESSDNKERYMMLRRLGVDEKMIRKTLFIQIAIFFLFPLIVAIIHSIFGIMFASTILETFGNEKLLSSIIMTAIFLIFIYGGYFIITYLCSRSMISEKE